MVAVTEQIFDYKSPFLLNALRDSAHKSKRQGAGSDFYRKTLFWSEPNPARIDLASSVKDPFESVYVKSFRQRSRLDVLCLIDGSSSMEVADKVSLAAQCERSIAASVGAQNDSYRSYLLAQTVQPLTDEDSVVAIFDRQASQPNNTAAAFAESYRLLPKRSGIVFLISDFHWTVEQFQQRLSALSEHYVVPVVLWQSAEYDNYPLWRFSELQDSETGGRKLIFITPKQKQWIQAAYDARKIALQQWFQRFQSRPFWLIDVYSPVQMSAFFYGE